MTKTYCDMCGKVLNPVKSRDLDTEWLMPSSPTGWLAVAGDLCEACDEKRQRLHAQLDALLLNRCELPDVKLSVCAALNDVQLWGGDGVGDSE